MLHYFLSGKSYIVGISVEKSTLVGKGETTKSAKCSSHSKATFWIDETKITLLLKRNMALDISKIPLYVTDGNSGRIKWEQEVCYSVYILLMP